MKILIIEDELALCDSIATYLKGEEYTCEIATDFKSALYKTEIHEYDCIVLDLSLPGGSGFEILKQLKANNKMEGILIISAKNSIEDKVNGLKLGADDYLPKPFHLSELSARIAAIIRRKYFYGNNLLVFNEITLDTNAKIVIVNNRTLELTKKEYELFLYLLTNKGRVISKNAIAEHLWGDDANVNLEGIYTHMKNIRKKLNDAGSSDYIKSIYGMGYKFTV